MTEPQNFSCVLIVEAAYKTQADRIEELLGRGSPTFGVPLQVVGDETHTVVRYGCHTWLGSSCVSLYSQMIGGTLPAVVAAEFTPAQVAEVYAHMIIHTEYPCEEPLDHWNAVIAPLNVCRLPPPEV